MSYELRRLRLHGLIERLPQSHRYRLTAQGLRSALFYTRVYARILRPAMAPITPDTTIGSAPALRRFQAAAAAIDAWCDEARIAA
jgi:predicted MarR family transcription regulator